MTKTYIITHNRIDRKPLKTTTPEQEARYPYEFQLRDADGETYFVGRSNDGSNLGPMDEIGESYGCTFIYYKDKHGRFELTA
jgi:hypothetical protein